jgi:hypothetical protein
VLETVARFPHPVEAQIVCAMLQSAGIRAVTADLNLVTLDWAISQALGGVKIQVPEADVEEAKQLIAAYHAGELACGNDGEAGRCGACGSEDLGVIVPNSQKALAVGVFVLLGAPIYTSTQRVCNNCGAVESES